MWERREKEIGSSILRRGRVIRKRMKREKGREEEREGGRRVRWKGGEGGTEERRKDLGGREEGREGGRGRKKEGQMGEGGGGVRNDGGKKGVRTVTIFSPPED